MLTLTRMGDFKLTRGESLRWDDRHEHLDFIDCATQMLRWLDHAVPRMHSMKLPTVPAAWCSPTPDSWRACRDSGLCVMESGSSRETGVRASRSTLCNAERLAVLIPTAANEGPVKER